jgi:hypothetical protein
MPMRVVAIPQPLPVRLNLHLVRDIRAALQALQDIEHLLDHVDNQLEPQYFNISGQWRSILGGVESKLCERNRCLKRAMFEGTMS